MTQTSGEMKENRQTTTVTWTSNRSTYMQRSMDVTVSYNEGECCYLSPETDGAICVSLPLLSYVLSGRHVWDRMPDDDRIEGRDTG